MTLLRPALALLAVLALAGCTTPAPGGGDSGPDEGGGDAGGSTETSTSLDCSSVSDPEYKLFIDPRLTIIPLQQLYTLEAGDVINFTDTGAGDVYTTYAYDSYYIDNGSVFPSSGEIFVGAEQTHEFTLEGPQAPTGIDGGPYAGIVEIQATTDAGTTPLARLCVVFATSE